MHSKQVTHTNQGFTLLETLIVVVIIGIVSAIAIPNWQAFVNLRYLNSAQDRVYWTMQEAKRNAVRDKITWQASFRETPSGTVQWAVHPATSDAFIPAGVLWHDLGKNIQVDKYKNSKDEYETTLDSPGTKTIAGPWRVQFNSYGNTNGQLGRITLQTTSGGKAKRCVIVSTLIGTLRTGKEHPKVQDGKYCY